MIAFVVTCEKHLRSDEPRKGLKVAKKRQVMYLNKLADIVRQPLDRVSRKKVRARAGYAWMGARGGRDGLLCRLCLRHGWRPRVWLLATFDAAFTG